MKNFAKALFWSGIIFLIVLYFIFGIAFFVAKWVFFIVTIILLIGFFKLLFDIGFRKKNEE